MVATARIDASALIIFLYLDTPSFSCLTKFIYFSMGSGAAGVP